MVLERGGLLSLYRTFGNWSRGAFSIVITGGSDWLLVGMQWRVQQKIIRIRIILPKMVIALRFAREL